MDGFLKFIGLVVFVLALAAAVLVTLTSREVGIMAWATTLPIMVGGAATYALGAILENLIAMKKAGDRHTELLELMREDLRKRPQP